MRVRAWRYYVHQAESGDARAERNGQRGLWQRQARRFIVNRRRANDQQRQQVHRSFTSDSFLRLAFEYEPNIQYYAHSKVVIGAMDKECPHCNALKFKNETTGMCCASGKVVTPPRLCNGTRLVIKKLMKNVVEATILNGKFRGENILLPRIPIIPTDVPIQFKRLQFPIRLAFAMTINKSQGQTMSVCGLDLSTPCFSHGQLYVACSRVGKPSSLFVLAKDGITKNIVHSIALRDW
jgi:hypothetical protein